MSGHVARAAFLPLIALAALAAAPEADLHYFSTVRDVRISQPARQNYLILDPEIWQHARPDLADLRLYGPEPSKSLTN